MQCTPDDYRDDIACLNLTREQEDQLLQTLWEMMRTMVEMGWDVDAIHTLLPEFSQLSDQSGDDPSK